MLSTLGAFRSGTIMSFVALVVAVASFAFAAASGSTPCAYAAGGSCSVGDDEVVDGELGIKANTANTLTVTHAITADRTITIPDVTDTLVGIGATQTLTNKTLTSPVIGGAPTAAGATWGDGGSHTTIDINGGTIDGTTLGASSASTIVGSTIDATTDFTIGGTVLTDGNIADTGTFVINTTTGTSFSDDNITNVGDIALDSISPDGVSITLGGPLDVNNENITNIDVDSGAIDGTTIGGSSPAAGTFTTLTATTLGGALDVNNENLTNVDINSGAIDGTTIGASSPTTGQFTTGTFTTAIVLGDGDQVRWGDSTDITAAWDGADLYFDTPANTSLGFELDGTDGGTGTGNVTLKLNARTDADRKPSINFQDQGETDATIYLERSATQSFTNTAANYLVIGTSTTTDVVIGTNNIGVILIDGTSQQVTIDDTLSVNDSVDLNNNNLNNVGNASTDITATNANFGVEISSTITTETLAPAVATFSVDTNVHTVDCDGGGNTITTITAGSEGQLLTLLFVDSDCTISDNASHTANTVDLSAAFVSADDTVLQLLFAGGSWYEISRSVN